jgi:hypothetical protein
VSETAVVIGLGELGSTFALGFLKSGVSVVPVLRGTTLSDVAREHPRAELVLVAVAEDDLAPVLGSLPGQWRDRVALLQNELLPDAWQRHAIREPTVIVVWFEKKPGRLVHEVLPSNVYGREAELVVRALERLGLGIETLASEDELIRALVDKNVYILTTNIAGLETGGTVSQLWRDHRARAVAVLDDVLALEAARLKRALPRAEIIETFVRAVAADPDHACTGRSAPARLARALSAGAELGLELPALTRIAAARARGTPAE